VAIIDFDVHHGNGTEDIVRHYNQPERLFFASIHISDRSAAESYTFYPGSGVQDDLEMNIMNTGVAPLWRRGARTARAPGGSGGGHNSGVASGGRVNFKSQVVTRLLPAMRAFNPDLILISAGFDAGKNDIGNSKIDKKYNDGIDLEPEDFTFLAREVQRVADICCDGRVVSVLEGGYGKYDKKTDIFGLGKGAVPARIDRSNLAENCAAHLRGLIGTSVVGAGGGGATARAAEEAAVVARAAEAAEAEAELRADDEAQ
jgi:acetoin utilization deacetylase AcuC-like enzyme